MRILVMAALALLSATAHAGEWNGTETPDYTVERELAPGVEIRAYPAMVMAAVTVEGSRREAGSAAFRTLAGYIFGANSTGESIAMTAPVISKPATMLQYRGEPVMDESSPEGSRTWTQAFILPSEYAVDELPLARDPSIRIFRTEPYRVGAVAFQGAGTQAQYAEARQILTRYLADAGIEHASVPEYAGYDGPRTPPARKRHEVHFRLLE